MVLFPAHVVQHGKRFPEVSLHYPVRQPHIYHAAFGLCLCGEPLPAALVFCLHGQAFNGFSLCLARVVTYCDPRVSDGYIFPSINVSNDARGGRVSGGLEMADFAVTVFLFQQIDALS
ncbi:hypothetical protein CB1_001944001 [Camelus ferus]|nr:hypothetical protein CB1_001944001 [Camelus ferus]